MYRDEKGRFIKKETWEELYNKKVKEFEEYLDTEVRKIEEVEKVKQEEETPIRKGFFQRFLDFF